MGPEFTHLLDSLGWAVLNSIWQGGVAFIIVVLLRVFLRNGSPALRYIAQMLVLTGCLFAFFVTFAVYAGAHSPETFRATSEGEGQLVIGGLIPAFDTSQNSKGLYWPDISGLTPFIALMWGIGFLALSLRYAFAYGQVQQLKVLGVSEAPLKWKLRFVELMEKSGLYRPAQLLVSQHISSPMTLGFLKPVVLVPTGFLTGIPTDQVEAVLLHELAHIRRHDYLFNLLQTAIRTVLFYHPAVHIISRWIDRDREQACDDIAVAKSRNAGALLLGLAALRLQSGSLAMAATGTGEETPLLDRLSRLAGQNPAVPRRPEHILMSLLSVLMIGAVYIGAMARADAHPHLNTQSLRIETPEAPAIPDIVISPDIPHSPVVRPIPPVLPPLPPSHLSGSVDEVVFENFIETDKAMWKSFEIVMDGFEQSLEDYIESTILDDDTLEELIEGYEDYAEDMEEIFIDRRESIEDQFEHYIEQNMEDSDFSQALEETIAFEVERAVLKAEQAIRDNFRSSQKTRDYAHEQVKISQKRAENNRRDSAAEARKARETSRKQARTYDRHDEKSRYRHEAFRDAVMRELLDDGLIKSKSDSFTLSHPKTTLILNGATLPKKLRGKYCEMWDDAGFEDGHTEVSISPDHLKILTDYKDGQPTTRVTYGTWKQ